MFRYSDTHALELITNNSFRLDKTVIGSDISTAEVAVAAGDVANVGIDIGSQSTENNPTSTVDGATVTFNEQDYVLTFADEFTGAGFSAWTGYGSGGRWATSIRPTTEDARTTAGNGELQYYVDPDMNSFENPFSVVDGQLSISADPLNGDQVVLAEGLEYSSGFASTEQTFRFERGYVEIRAKVPSERGMWSALWLQTVADGGPPSEIDILEVLGEEPSKAYHDTHGNPDGDSGASYTTIDTSEDFHTYGLLWEEQTITWLIDGEVVRTEDNFVNEEMFLTINLAIGGWAQDPDDTTNFSEGLEIDYARIFEPIETVSSTDYVVLGESSRVTDIGTSDEQGIDVQGSRWADTVEGSIVADIISGNAGNDLVFADAGDDVVFGGTDDDTLDGGSGADNIFGGDGNDDLNGGQGDDYLFGESGNDYLVGGDGTDILYGSQGDDFVSGGYGDDNIFGNTGDDRLTGGNGEDKLVGGEGADLLVGGKGDDHFWGGQFGADQAADTFLITRGSGADTIYDFENGIDVINLSSFDTTITVLESATMEADGAITIALSDSGGKEGDSLTIFGVTLQELNEDMFLF